MERGNENLREQFLANGDRGGHASLDSDLSSSPGRRNTPKYDTRKHFSPLFPRPSPPMRAASHEKKSPPSSGRRPVALMAADEAGRDDDDDDEDGASNLATAFNIFSNYVGMVLLSQAYCFRLSGWLALPLLLALTAFGGYTGALIVESYKTIAARGETVPSYAQIGFHAIGPPGKWLVIVSSIVETFFAILNMNIIIWQNAALLLPSVDLQWLVAGCVALSFPVNWLRDFEELAWLSAFGFAACLCICAVVVFQVATVGPDLAPPDREVAIVGGAPMAASIMLAGLTGHVGIPPMYCSMRTPDAFHPTLAAAFAAIFAMYALVGVCGYLLYGGGASVLITSDMGGATTGWASTLLVGLVTAAITFKLFTSVPMCVQVLVDVCENMWLEHNKAPLSAAASQRVRLGWWLASILASFGFYSSLEYLTAFVGLNSLLISVLLPIFFYLRLHRRLSGARAAALYALLALSVVLSVVIGYLDIAQYIASLSGEVDADGEPLR